MMKNLKSTREAIRVVPEQAPRNTTEELVIPILREEVHKELRKTGTVRISKSAREQEAMVQDSLASETVDVEQVPVHQIVDRPPPIRTEEDITVIPILQEELIVTKQWRVVEEWRLAKRRSVSDYRENMTIRVEEVTVECVNAEVIKEASKG